MAFFAAPVMRRQRSGVILITGSTAAIRPRPGGQCYAASKGAVTTIAKSLALELAPFGKVLFSTERPSFTELDDHVREVKAR